MRIANRTISVLAVVAAVALSASTAQAQWHAMSGSMSRSQGNSTVRGSHYGYGVAVSSPQHAYLRTTMRNTVGLFGATVNGSYFQGESYTNTRTGTRRTALTLRSAGNDVVDRRFLSSSSHRIIDLNLKLFPIDPQFSVWIGFIPVTVSANAGLTLQTSVSLGILPHANTATMFGSTSAAAYGVARVMVGFSFFGAGVEAQLEFARSNLRLGLTAKTGHVGGTSEINISSWRLKIVAFLQLFVRIGEITIIDLSGPQYRHRALVS